MASEGTHQLVPSTAGATPDQRFNALHGARRPLFSSSPNACPTPQQR